MWVGMSGRCLVGAMIVYFSEDLSRMIMVSQIPTFFSGPAEMSAGVFECRRGGEGRGREGRRGKGGRSRGTQGREDKRCALLTSWYALLTRWYALLMAWYALSCVSIHNETRAFDVVYAMLCVL